MYLHPQAYASVDFDAGRITTRRERICDGEKVQMLYEQY